MRAWLIVVLGAVGCGGGPEADGPTWHQDVAPIVYEHCASCHQADQIGPFDLTEYANAAPWGPAMAAETAARRMPPFGADNSGECGEWRDARWLSEAEIATIGDWVAASMPEGTPPEEPLTVPEPDRLTAPDMTVDIGVDYTPVASADYPEDDYRCFLLDPGLSEAQFIKAFEVEPGDPEIVHHVILWSLDDDNAQAEAEALAGEDGSYTCFGSSGVRASTPLATWAPGAGVVRYPEGTGVKLEANRKMVMQMHYHLLPESRSDRTQVHLDLEPSVDREAITWLLLDPGLAIPAGQDEATYSFDFSLSDLGVPVGVNVWGVLPHMHKRGTSITATVDGECLVDVPVWDFEWQQQYFFTNPQYVGPDDVVQITCSYDTSEDSSPIGWGDGSNDEMCLVGVYVTL